MGKYKASNKVWIEIMNWNNWTETGIGRFKGKKAQAINGLIFKDWEANFFESSLFLIIAFKTESEMYWIISGNWMSGHDSETNVKYYY